MAEQTFKSPNFYEREIDLSSPTVAGPSGVPALVIGTSNKGPAFVPSTVANFSEFTTSFGGLDVKYFGPYAVNEFLKHRSALTYMRVLGSGANSSDSDLNRTLTYGTVLNAGFRLKGQATNQSGDGRYNGVMQFISAKHVYSTVGSTGFPVFDNNSTFAGSNYANLVRAAIMTPNTSRVMILTSSGGASSVGASLNDSTVASHEGKFNVVISSSLGSDFYTTDGTTGVKIFSVSLDPSSKDYVGKVLNRDPDKFVQEQHYLHADFPVDVNVAYVSGTCPIAIMSGSQNVSSNGDSSRNFLQVFGSYDARFQAPQTSYFISQPFGTTEYDLFKFEALDDGEYANKLYKISISNIKASVNDANKYGTFSVQVRDWNDTDTSLNIIEQFTNCTLDPNSDNYIAKLIGDRKVFYNFDAVNSSEKRLVATGKYNNNSRYIRVVMNAEIEGGNVPQESLPFGFRGPDLINVNPSSKYNDVLSVSNSRLTGKLGSYTELSSSFLPPVPHRYKVTRGELSGAGFDGSPGPSEQANTAYYWGVKFERTSTSSDPMSSDILNSNVVNEKNGLLESYTKFMGIKKLDALVTGSTKDTLNSNKFSLSKVALYNTSFDHLTSSINNHMKEAAYIRDASLDTTDYTWNENNRRRITFATLLSSGSAALFNRFSAYSKFTSFMYGGFDGTNFLNRDARRLNDKSVSFDSDAGGSGGASSGFIPEGFPAGYNPSGEDVKNNGVASYLTAVEVATDPLKANNNILAIPGIRESYITDQASAKVREYGLSMYVMDIPSYDDNGYRMYDDATVKPNVNRTTTNFDNRVIDNNYTAVYYPDIFIDDATNRRKVKVPASVAALGALAFNDRVEYPWFAPAGFNRASLDFVTNIAVRLGSADRDRLYESRINPIASFPRLGYVIYGQKTLQINKSALDRVNVRRLMLEIKRIIIGIAQRIVFEQNTASVRNKFVADTSFQLGLIQAQAGVEAFQVVMNESNNTQEDVDLNRLNGRIVVVPTRVVEYIAIDFIVTNSGVSFV